MDTIWIVLLILIVVVALLAFTGHLGELIKKLGGALDKFHPGDRVIWTDSAQKQWPGEIKGKSGLMNRYPVLLDAGKNISVDDRSLSLVSCPHRNAPAMLDNMETVVPYVAPVESSAVSVLPIDAPVQSISTGRRGHVQRNESEGVRVLWADNNQKEPRYTPPADLKILYGDAATF